MPSNPLVKQYDGRGGFRSPDAMGGDRLPSRSRDKSESVRRVASYEEYSASLESETGQNEILAGLDDIDLRHQPISGLGKKLIEAGQIRPEEIRQTAGPVNPTEIPDAIPVSMTDRYEGGTPHGADEIPPDERYGFDHRARRRTAQVDENATYEYKGDRAVIVMYEPGEMVVLMPEAAGPDDDQWPGWGRLPLEYDEDQFLNAVQSGEIRKVGGRARTRRRMAGRFKPGDIWSDGTQDKAWVVKAEPESITFVLYNEYEEDHFIPDTKDTWDRDDFAGTFWSEWGDEPLPASVKAMATRRRRAVIEQVEDQKRVAKRQALALLQKAEVAARRGDQRGAEVLERRAAQIIHQIESHQGHHILRQAKRTDDTDPDDYASGFGMFR